MIDVTTLNNGVRVINEYMPDVESISINVWVNTGSDNETKLNNGISHFLEHMAFKGTKKRNTKQIAEEFDDIGGYVNAFTAKSKTAYYTKVLKENVEKAVELLADIFQNSTFSQEEMEKERQVILQELAMSNDDPTSLIDDYFYKTAFDKQPHGRTILGSANNIKRFTREDLLNYVDRQYKTQNIVISFAGNLKNDTCLNLVNKYFNNLNVGTNKSPQLIKYTGGYFKKNKKLEQSQILLGFESCSIVDEDFYTANILSIILGVGMSSRLFQEIREKRGLCYTISAGNYSNNNTGVFEIYSAVSHEKINETIVATIEELKKITQKISQEEFDRAIIKLKSSLLIASENNSNRARKNASNILDRNKIVSLEDILDELSKITIYKIQNLMVKILNSKPTVAILGKIDQNIIDLNGINKIIKI